MLRQFTGMWKFRHFLLALVRLDFRNRYSRSLLGIGWAIVQPIVMAAVFVLVFSRALGQTPEGYATTLLLGLAIWGFLRDAAVSGCQSFTAHESYIHQSPLPVGLYPLRLVLGSAIHSGISLVVALVAVVLSDGNCDKLALFWAVVPVLVLVLIAGWAVATIFSFAQVYFHDTKHLLEIGSLFLFFLTPIVFPPSLLIDKGLGWMTQMNPVNVYLELIRTPLTTGAIPPFELYLQGVAFTAAVFGLAAASIAWFRTRLVFHI